MKFSQGNGKLVEKQNFSNKFDKLMDIIKCQYPIQLCSELGFVKVGNSYAKFQSPRTTFEHPHLFPPNHSIVWRERGVHNIFVLVKS